MDEGKSVVDEFYEVYEPLRKKYHLLSHIHSTLLKKDEDFIEIFEDLGKEKKSLFKAKGEIEQCYGTAILNLRNYKQDKEKADERKDKEDL